MTPGKSLEVDPLELSGVGQEPAYERLTVAENQLREIGFDAVQAVHEGRRRLVAREPQQAGRRRANAVEQRGFVLVLLARQHGVREAVLHDPWPRQREQLAEALALVHGAGFAADLGVRLPEQLVVGIAVDCDEMPRRRRLVALEHAVIRSLIDLRGLPGAQPFLDLIGIPRGIARSAERFGADAGGGLMMLSAAGAIGAHRDHHVGPREADQPHVVADDLVLAPLLERLVDAERVAEVHCAREELLGAVDAVRSQQLLGAQHAERLENLGADLILSAVAARPIGFWLSLAHIQSATAQSGAVRPLSPFLLYLSLASRQKQIHVRVLFPGLR